MDTKLTEEELLVHYKPSFMSCAPSVVQIGRPPITCLFCGLIVTFS